MYAHDDRPLSSLALMSSISEINQDSKRGVCQKVVGSRRAAAVEQWIISDQGAKHRVQAGKARDEDDRGSQESRVSFWSSAFHSDLAHLAFGFAGEIGLLSNSSTNCQMKRSTQTIIS